MNFKNKTKSISIYKTNSYKKFKRYERFKFLLKHMYSKVKMAHSFLDIGCAKGEYIYMLKEYFPGIRYCGLEYSKELIKLAKKEPFLRNVNFVQADARSFNLGEEFDIVLMSGVLSIFDDYKEPLRSLIRHIGPGGTGYLFGMFNRFDMDVVLKYKNNVLGFKVWESGLNNFSLKGIKNFLSKFCKSIKVYEFNLSFDLKGSKNPIRSYTLNTKERGRIITNGTGIITDFYLIEFQKR